MVQTYTKPVTDVFENEYIYRIAVGTDALLVLDNKNEVVKWVIEGTATEAVVLAPPDEDNFLDTLMLLKECIESGLNPFNVFDFE